MDKRKKLQRAMDFDDYLNEQLKNPVFKKYYDEYGKQLEIAYQILQLRKREGLSQAELARKIGTKQTNIARLESGQQNFTIDTLQKLAKALRRNLKIDFVK
ncbi:MAG TPA: helix-turn-helix transcriptional regulator [Thermodesulfobacteriota bacterium]